MRADLTPHERTILNRIQADFPVLAEPYQALAPEVGGTAAEVHEAVQRLRRSGVIRRLGGIFDAEALGHCSTLVGARVDPVRLEAVAAVAGSFAEVTHNYERADACNLWFTVVARSRERLQHILDVVGGCAGVGALYDLPARRRFKVRAVFSLGEAEADGSADRVEWEAEAPRAGSVVRRRIEPLDETIIRLACGDVDGTVRPFRGLAWQIGVSEDVVLERLNGYLVDGAMRRFGAILRHHAAGIRGNGMTVWDVDAAQVEAVGRHLAACQAVTHCYERPRVADWRYNLYAMLHAADRAACGQLARALAAETGIPGWKILFSGREFKKTSVVYFASAAMERDA